MLLINIKQSIPCKKLHDRLPGIARDLGSNMAKTTSWVAGIPSTIGPSKLTEQRTIEHPVLQNTSINARQFRFVGIYIVRLCPVLAGLASDAPLLEQLLPDSETRG